MNYIRIKDKILSTKDLINAELGDKRFKDIYISEDYVLYKAIKKADTIEQLCDEFVLVIDDKIHQIILGETTLKDEINIIKHNKLHKIYGAIWTDKGLIYVAKMNDKGELELI